MFRMLHDGDRACVTYLLADETSGEAVVIDPQADDLLLLQAVLAEGGMRPRWVLRTHVHDEAPRRERQALQALGGQILERMGAVGDRECLPFGHERLQVLHTPGHTDQGLSVLWRDRLFCGCLLSTTGCHMQARPQSPAALWDSVTQQVFTLPGETLVFSSRSAPGRIVNTVHEHRCHHPWFAGLGRDEFLALFDESLDVA